MCGQVLVTLCKLVNISHVLYILMTLRPLALASKGTLCQWYLMDVFNSQSLSPLQKISMPTPPINSHLVAISNDYFALASVVDKGVCITLWDIPYFTDQAHSVLTSDLRTVCSVGHRVVVCGSEAVTVAMVITGYAGGTLAAALGRGQSLSELLSSTPQVSLLLASRVSPSNTLI